MSVPFLSFYFNCPVFTPDDNKSYGCSRTVADCDSMGRVVTQTYG